MSVLRFDEFELDVDQRKLLRAGRSVAIQPKTLDLLACLAARQDSLITRDELLKAVWPGQVVTDNALARAIAEVRKALGDDASNPTYIQTVPGTGYRFIAPVATRPVDPAKRRWLIWAATTLVAIVAVVAFFGPSPGPLGDPTQASTDVAALNAQRFFHLGLDRFSRRTSAGRKEARAHFIKALQLNPQHAGAMSGLAILEILSLPPPRSSSDALTIAKPLVDRALEIDPELGLAYAAIGLALMDDSPDEARRHLETAIALDSGFADAHVWQATLLADEGRLMDAIEAQRIALALNPAHSSAAGNLAMNLTKAGRIAEARELIMSQAELPDAWGAMVYFRVHLAKMSGDIVEEFQIYRELLERFPENRVFPSQIARALIRIGMPEAAIGWLDRARSVCDRNPIPIAEIHRIAGEPHLAREILLGELSARDMTVGRAPVAWKVSYALTAIHEGDDQTGIAMLRERFPRPADVTGWRGEFARQANDAQYLAYALRRSGADGDALKYLAHIRAEISRRKTAGYHAHWPLTLTEARNELLLGQISRAIDLLAAAVDQGYQDGSELRSDPRWQLLVGNRDFERIMERIENALRQARIQLSNQDIVPTMIDVQSLPAFECSKAAS